MSPSGSRGVGERVELVSRALMCVSACEMTTAASHADFLLHLEEKKEVARVQLMVLDALQVGAARITGKAAVVDGRFLSRSQAMGLLLCRTINSIFSSSPRPLVLRVT